MIIKINDKSGNNIAECELLHHDTGVWYVQHKANIINVFGDLKQSDKEFEDYVEVIDIDVDNLISPKKMQMIKSLAGAWATFETLRSEYELGCSDDDMYALEIIGIPHIYGFITDNEYKQYVEALNQFLGFDGNFYNNSEYDYSELDEFIQNLNPIYEK